MTSHTEDWLRIRLAALDAIERRMTRPLRWIPNAFVGAAVVYAAGFLRFNLLDHTPVGTSFAEIFQILVIASSVIVLLVTAPAMAVSIFVDTRLRSSRKVFEKELSHHTSPKPLTGTISG